MGTGLLTAWHNKPMTSLPSACAVGAGVAVALVPWLLNFVFYQIKLQWPHPAMMARLIPSASFEEILFRGIMFPAFRTRLRFLPATLLLFVFFAVSHSTAALRTEAVARGTLINLWRSGNRGCARRNPP